jgi:hypothetical protein
MVCNRNTYNTMISKLINLEGEHACCGLARRVTVCHMVGILGGHKKSGEPPNGASEWLVGDGRVEGLLFRVFFLCIS